MSLTDDAADAIILRWPKGQQVAAPKARPTWRHHFDWLAFPTWIARLVAEMTGWLAILGMASMWF